MSNWVVYTRPYLCLGCGVVYAVTGMLGGRTRLFCRFCRHVADHLSLH